MKQIIFAFFDRQASTTNIVITTPLHRGSRSSDRRAEVKAAMSLSFIMGGFLICWLPFFIWMPLVHLMVRRIREKIHCYKENEVYRQDSEILHKTVRDTTYVHCTLYSTRISACFSEFRAVSCSIFLLSNLCKWGRPEV